MAAVNTIDSGKVFNDFVTGLPPKPNHVIPKFHNRSNLFPSTFTQKVFEEKENRSTSNRQAWSANPRLRQPPDVKQNNLHINTTTNNAKETVTEVRNTATRRRPCSAKARLEHTSRSTRRHKEKLGKDSNEFSTNNCLALVPINGKEVPVVDIGDSAPFPSYHYQYTSKEKYVPDDTTPFHSGSAENRIPPMPMEFNHNPETSTEDGPLLKPMVHGLNSFQVLYGTDSDGKPCDIKYDLQPPRIVKPPRSLPSTLEPLRPWLTETSIIPGISTEDCLMFLPSMSDYNDLPEVPPPHSVHEDLPYTTKLQKQPTATKKYHHPSFDKKHVEDWVCNHSRPGTAIDINQRRSRYRNYLPRYLRTPGEVREEILELENLMQGLGNLDSDCGMVKFQGEIDRFRQMYEDTMKMVPERLLHSPKDPDTFGVKEFLKQHVVIMNEIRKKHTLCLEELRTLEAESGIDSSRKYFKHRSIPPDT